jgi:hypothetical protein
MKKLAWVCGAMALFSALAVPSSVAHHSVAMYDLNTPKTIRGAVTRFRWVNPHVYVHVLSDAADGQPSVEWVLEGSSPANMTRVGWTRNSLTVKARVDAEFSPIRDGSLTGLCRRFVLVDSGVELKCIGALTAGEKANLP